MNFLLRAFRAAQLRLMRIALLVGSWIANAVFWAESRRLASEPVNDKARPHASNHPGTPAELSLVVCVVVGPNEERGIRDLLDAARCYLGKSCRVVVVDDSGGLQIARLTRTYGNVDYLRNWKLRGFRGLENSLRQAYAFALQNYRFMAMLKVDTDAMITGPGLAHDILTYLESHPEAGMLGSYRETCTGARRSFVSIARLFEKDLQHWTPLIQQASRYGYELGEHAQGGAYVVSYNCLHAMAAVGHLAPHKIRKTWVSEDGVFSLYVRALGYEIHDFARNGPLAIAWRGLPMPPNEIVAQGKKVIHSVKYSKEDLLVRDYFRQRREAAECADQVAAPSTSGAGTHVLGGPVCVKQIETVRGKV